MILLGIETATQQVGAAVGGVEGVFASFHSAKGRRHAETLAPAIDFVAHAAGIELREISVVAVDVGPGLFTGLRVGIASARALGASACEIAPRISPPAIWVKTLTARALAPALRPKLVSAPTAVAVAAV